MLKIIKTALIELFRLLGMTPEYTKQTAPRLLRSIEKEAVTEIQEGLSDKDKTLVTDFDSAFQKVGEETICKILETASSRMLVAYYVENKKGYTENQKEVFLTFLTTNKIKRELERKR